jgi:hypothetical protein
MTISVSRVMAAEPSVVWDLLVDTSRWSDWGPSDSLPGPVPRHGSWREPLVRRAALRRIERLAQAATIL